MQEDISSHNSRSLQQTTNACGPVTAAGKTITYDGCVDFTKQLKLTFPFQLQYTLTPSVNGKTVFKGAIQSTPAAKSYASIAFPASVGGGMIGSKSVFVAPDAKSATGASVYGILLKSFDAASINAAKGSFALTDVYAEKNPDGSLVGLFTAELPGTPESLTSSLQGLLYAVGIMNADGSLGTHKTANKVTYPWGKTTVQYTMSATPSTTPSTNGGAVVVPATDDDDDEDTVSGPNQSLLWAHVWLMTIGFGVLIPLGAVIGHSFKDNKYWFQMHRAIQTLGFVCGLAGLTCILVYCDQKYGDAWSTDEEDHRNQGIAVLALCFVQILSIVWRPNKESKLRRPWYIWHLLVGLASMILAIYVIYNAMYNVEPTPAWSKIVYSIILGLICLLAIGKDSLTYYQKRKGYEVAQFPSKVIARDDIPPSSGKGNTNTQNGNIQLSADGHAANPYGGNNV